MSNLTVVFRDQEVRIVSPDPNKEWFHAGDVFRILGHSDPYRTLPNLLHSYEYQEWNVGIGGRPALYVTEPGLYKLIFKSKSEYALEFQDWLAYDVLPSLRRTGIYSTKTEDCERFESIGLRSKLRQAQLDLVERLGKIAREGSIEELEPAIKSIDLTRNMLNELLRSESTEADSQSAIEGEGEKQQKGGRSTKRTRSFCPAQSKLLEDKILQVAANRGKPIAARDVQMLSNSSSRPTPEQVKECFYSLAAQGKGEVTAIGKRRIRFSAN